MNLKKNDWLLLSAVAAYSYLFFEQAAGLNYLIFTIILLGIMVQQTSKQTIKQTSWWLVAGASLISGINVVMVNSGLSVLANIISLVLLAGFSRIPQTSLFVTALNSMYSITTSLFSFTFFRERFFPESPGGLPLMLAGINVQQVKIVGIPVAVTSFFLVIYCSASATFRQLVGSINFSFISFSWLLFTFVGFWLLFGFFRQQLIQPITEADLSAGNTLVRLRKTLSYSIKNLGLKHEYKAGVILLVLLNLLLLAFNLSDAWYLTLGELPTGIPFSEYLHQGVNMLIFSILLAIAVLLYLFRGNQNFFSGNRPLQLLAYAWLAQNIILVLFTITKNSIYIIEFGLTYKRIGVYTYLTLTAIGLVTSFIKVAQVKNNWFLFRKNAWSVYLVLLLLSCFNWDRIIANHNLNFTAEPDFNYLFSLPDAAFGPVYTYTKHNKNKLPKELVARVEKHRPLIKERIYNQDWQTWNYNDYLLAEALK